MNRYLIINSDGMRLCMDNCWRGFANFGDGSSCVKSYKTLGHASRVAKRIRGFVVDIPAGFEIDASGEVIETVAAGEGYERTIRHNIKEYIVAETLPVPN
jgi:hypothetical protein